MEVVFEVEVSVELGDADGASSNGGFFFDITDVQSDMTQRFRFNFAAKPGSRVLAMRNRESGDSSEKKVSSSSCCFVVVGTLFF